MLWVGKLAYKLLWVFTKINDKKTKIIYPLKSKIDEFSFLYKKSKILCNFYHMDEEIKPMVIDIHGGGWAYGSKDSNSSYNDYFAQNGFNEVSLSYKFLFKADHYEMLHQIDLLVEYLLENKDKFHINENSLFLSGDSAGGELALYYALIMENDYLLKLYNFKKKHISGVIASHGGFFLKEIHAKYQEYANKFLFGKKYKENPYFINFNIEKDILNLKTPLLLISSKGDDDFVGPNTKKLVKIMDENNVKYDLIFVDKKECGHIFHVFNPYTEDALPVNEKTLEWLKTKI